MKPRPRQLTLALAHRPAMGRADFLVSGSNRAAFDAVTGEQTPPGRLALSGPAGAGKSHLASIWGALNGAVVLAATDLTENRVGAFGGVGAVVIEDADHVAGLAPAQREAAETHLFHALNLTAAHRIGLLITGRRAPARWRIATPDLASRLGALDHVAILPPDDALLSAILEKLFADRQLSVGSDTLRFLVLRMERSFAAAERIVAHLDRIALAGRRPVTRNLAMELYERDPGVISGAGEA